MRQPLARLIPVLLEPASGDSLAAWGFFNRALARQWSSEPGIYPVLRLDARPPVPLVVVEPTTGARSPSLSRSARNLSCVVVRSVRMRE